MAAAFLKTKESIKKQKTKTKKTPENVPQ